MAEAEAAWIYASAGGIPLLDRCSGLEERQWQWLRQHGFALQPAVVRS